MFLPKVFQVFQPRGGVRGFMVFSENGGFVEVVIQQRDAGDKALFQFTTFSEIQQFGLVQRRRS